MYIVLFNYQLGIEPKKYKFSKACIEVKQNLSQNLNGNKIIITSGSNSLFSINSKYIEEKLKYKVANLAFWADMDISFLYYQLIDIVKKNDIILMPLEYQYYNRTNLTENFIDAMMWIRKEDYIKKLAFTEYMNFIRTVNPSKVFNNALNQQNKKSEFTKTNQLIKQRLADIYKDGYTMANKNEILNKSGTREAMNIDNKKIILDNFNIASVEISDHFIRYFKKISTLAKSKNAKLILTYPSSYQNIKIFKENNKYGIMTKALKKNLNNKNILIECNPYQSFLSDRKLIYDTQYHANRLGALVRTINLVDCIKPIINDFNYIISDLEAYEKTKRLEEIYTTNPKHAKKYFTIRKDYSDVRLNDLKCLKEALEAYKKDNTLYPASVGFDGLYTSWGSEGPDWIKGLSPRYIKTLPRDPRNNKNKSQQYLYKSNGKDYKLIAHSTNDCDTIKIEKAYMIDPKRNCKTYGFWTEGAKSW